MKTTMTITRHKHGTMNRYESQDGNLLRTSARTYLAAVSYDVNGEHAGVLSYHGTVEAAQKAARSAQNWYDRACQQIGTKHELTVSLDRGTTYRVLTISTPTHVVQGLEHPEIYCLDCNDFCVDPDAAKPLRSENGQALICCNCGRDESGNQRPGYAGQSVWVETTDPALQEYEGRVPAIKRTTDLENLLELTSDLTGSSDKAFTAALGSDLDAYRSEIANCMFALAEIQTALEAL